MLKELKLSSVTQILMKKADVDVQHNPAKKKKRILMFAKLDAEKISLTECQRILKEQKQNPEAYNVEC